MIVELLVGAIFLYYLCLHGIYWMLLGVGAMRLRRHWRGVRFGEFQRIAESSLALPFSVIIPAHNEELVIINTVLGALKLRYPQHEVIVVNDGSDDRTLDVLIERFGMRRVPKVAQMRLRTEAVAAVYESLDYPNLIVVDKANGRRADAINAGANLARYPLLCIIDADSILEPDALVHSVRPFLRDPATIAAGGMVRPINGCVVENGRIVSAGVPHGMLALTQAVEYLRSFQWSRIALQHISSMLCISGAYMVVRKDAFVALGGCSVTAITDDIEFTLRLNGYVYEAKTRPRPRIAFIPDGVCYTEVPETHRVYAAQRNRWQRGTLQALLRHWRMTLNPRYGLTGLFGMPFFILFEALSALVEGASYVLLPLLYWLGLITPVQILVFLALAIGLGSVLSVSAVLLQELSRLRAQSTADLVRLILAGFVENLGYHQLHLLWRIGGTFQYFVRRRTDLGLMQRYGSHQRAKGS